MKLVCMCWSVVVNLCGCVLQQTCVQCKWLQIKEVLTDFKPESDDLRYSVTLIEDVSYPKWSYTLLVPCKTSCPWRNHLRGSQRFGEKNREKIGQVLGNRFFFGPAQLSYRITMFHCFYYRLNLTDCNI